VKQTHKFESGHVSQEAQYEFPYHYIPSLENGKFSQHLYWSYGLEYMASQNCILSILAEEEFESLVDIGCGDGRFLREASKRFPGKRLLGIDRSVRAINLAQAMNPGLTYICADICLSDSPRELFDVLILIEVLEHISPDSLVEFVAASAVYLRTRGRVMLTVPHVNVPVSTKHCQHFDSPSLRALLEPYYEIGSLVFLDRRVRVLRHVFDTLLGNALFILNSTVLLKMLFRIYCKHLFCCGENRCSKILAVGSKR